MRSMDNTVQCFPLAIVQVVILAYVDRCINKDPAKRPTARELLFHPLLFEVHSLKLLAAHTLVNTTGMNHFRDIFFGDSSVARPFVDIKKMYSFIEDLLLIIWVLFVL